jgi:RNAse (barnase) inhibitor barstar
VTSLPREAAGTAPAVETARGRSALVAVVDGALDRAGTLSAFGRALSFPAYYGHNLDALEECLRDLSWLPAGPVELVWEDGPLRSADPGTHDVVTAILADAVTAAGGSDRPLHVTLAGPAA